MKKLSKIKKRKEVEVIEFVDPYIKRRAVNKKKKPIFEDDSAKLDNISADFYNKIDKSKLFEDVILSLKETDDNKGLIKEVKKQKLERLGCDVSEKRYLNYKTMQDEIKKQKNVQNEIEDKRSEATNIANSLLMTNKNIRTNRQGKYRNEMKYRKHNTRSNKVQGDLVESNVGRFRNGILKVKKSFLP